VYGDNFCQISPVCHLANVFEAESFSRTMTWVAIH